ncbi:MAG: AI-2E family transporter [Lachnospiraceae bacterium]
MFQQKPNKPKYFSLGLAIFTVVSALLGVYYILFYSDRLFLLWSSFIEVFTPIIFGCILAYIMLPILNWSENKIVIPLYKSLGKDHEKHKKHVRGFSLLITGIIFLLIIALLAALFISQIIPSVNEIITNFDTYANNITTYFNTLLADNPTLQSNINNLFVKYSTEFDSWLNNTVMPQVTSIIMSISMSVLYVLVVFWNFIIGFIISIYILASKEVFAGQGKKIIYSIYSIKRANNIIDDVRFVHKTFAGFIVGKVIDSIIIGIICIICTTLMGTPYATLVSIFVGVTNVIPFFGPFIGAVPSVILIFVVAPMQPMNVVYFIIFILLLQQFDGNILGPKILGDSTGLSSIWVIISITVFGGFFGVPGMIIGVPTFAVIFSLIRRNVDRKLIDKNLPTDRETFINLGSIEQDQFIPYVPQNNYTMKPLFKWKNKKQHQDSDDSSSDSQ